MDSEIFYKTECLPHNWISVSNQQAVAAGSLINLATILYLNSIRVRVDFHCVLTLYVLFFPELMLTALPEWFFFLGACHCSICLLCVFWLSSSLWHYKGQKNRPKRKADYRNCMKSCEWTLLHITLWILLF